MEGTRTTLNQHENDEINEFKNQNAEENQKIDVLNEFLQNNVTSAVGSKYQSSYKVISIFVLFFFLIIFIHLIYFNTDGG